MNISLHIERLVLDGLNIGPGQGDQVKVAVEAELTRLLTNGGLDDALQSGGALPRVRTGGIEVANNENPARLGEQIAGAVYGGIGE
jgi:hypothetical protein